MNANKEIYIDSIKNRIFSRFPKAKNDPIVNIFIDACAHEFAQIRDEVDDFKSNLVQELSKGLAKGLFFGAKPSHALITCAPNANSVLIPAFSKFKFKITNPMYSGMEKITFSNVFDYRIYNHKITTATSDKAIWCIISSNDNNYNIDYLFGNKDFLLHFDIYNEDQRQNRLFKYHLTKCKIDFYFKNAESRKQVGTAELKRVDFNKKIANNHKVPLDEDEGLNADSEVNNNSFLSNATNDCFKDNMSFYADSFYNLFLSKNIEDDEKFDQVFSSEISQLHNLELSDEDVHLFLKIDVSSMADYEINYDALKIIPNCFPVFNVELLQLNNQIINSSVQPFNLNMPDSNSAFFGIYSVLETIINERNLQHKNVLESSPENIHLYSSGINRLSTKDADEIINKLLYKYDIEPLAFEKYKDIVDALKSKIKYKIFDVQLRDSSINNTDSVYLFYTPGEPIKTGNLEVKYLITNGQSGNGFNNADIDKLISATNIVSGNPLEIDLKSAKFLTSTIGGRDVLNENEKSFEFWNLFYSKGSIVTAEDVENYCYHFFGDNIKDIEIRKQYAHDELIVQRGNVIIEVRLTILISELRDQKNKPRFMNEAALLQHFLNKKSNVSLNEFAVKIDFAQY